LLKKFAIANRSRVSSARKVTTVNFQGRETIHGQELCGTPAVAAAAASINFMGYIFTWEELFVTPLQQLRFSTGK